MKEMAERHTRERGRGNSEGCTRIAMKRRILENTGWT
jgi:hypothetical protein